MIVKRKGGYHVVSEGGKNLGGPYKSRKAARKRLSQVEYFKHKKQAAMSMWVDEFGVSLSVDATGHEHKGIGVGGGQFVSNDSDKTKGVKNKTAKKLAQDALDIALKHGDKVVHVVSYLFSGKVQAMYSQSNDKIFLSSKINSKSQVELDRQVEIGWLSQSNPVLHELGHKKHADAAGEMYDSAKNHSFSDQQKQSISTKVSKYAATNGLEFVAEVYAGARAGKVYDDEIKRLFHAVTLGKVAL